MTAPAAAVALLYDDDAYQERTGVASATAAPAPGPVGLMGRQVAGRAFLDAYLTHGTWSELPAVVRDRESAASLARLWRTHPATASGSRRLRIVPIGEFHRTFFPTPPAGVLHAPQPPEPRFAWARQQGGPGAFALCGVTHTLCSPEAVGLLRALVTAPFEPYDALVCTSRAVLSMVGEVTGAYAEYLRGRLGGGPSGRPTPVRLEVIPLGVDTDSFRPAGPAERAEARRALGVAEGEVAALFVGRLSHHAKAHPFPMFRAAAAAAAGSGRALHLVLAGWAANAAVRDAFVAGARAFAPGVRTTFVDGTESSNRRAVWRAADVFVSLADSIQETFGLSVAEAMASGLPAVASDWDGYRDLVADGETGLLVPTATVEGATADATARLLLGEVGYDHFLAECSQATAVDPVAASEALTRLVSDDALRRRMGDAGRRRAVERFAWPGVVRAYEALWRDQEAERAAACRRVTAGRWTGRDGPAAYPAPERSFGGYPARRLDGPDLVEPVAGADAAVDELLTTPLTHHAADRRATDPGLIRRALAAAPCSVAALDEFWAGEGVARGVGRATLAWMLKYDLLRAAPVGAGGGPGPG